MAFRAHAAILCAALLALGGRAARADDPILTLLRRLRASEDPAERLRLVTSLAATGIERGVVALMDVVQNDPELKVRRAAVTALAGMKHESVPERLVELVGLGGPRRVREAVVRCVRERKDGAALLVRRLGREELAGVERALLLDALADFRDEESRSAVLVRCRDADAGVREAAWRALAQREDAGALRSTLVDGLLLLAQHDGSGLEVLDAFGDVMTPTQVPALERLAASDDMEIRRAAEEVLVRARAGPADEPSPGAAAPPPAKPDDRYAKPGRPDEEEKVPPPRGRSRFDLVYACDLTGSTTNTLPRLKQRILDEIAPLIRMGAAVRVGFVGYRDVDTNRGRLEVGDVLLPTLDRKRLRDFLSRLESKGIDRNGASLAPALRTTLDRMPWRWDAQREVQVFGDDVLDDKADALRTVGIHYRVDRTVTRVIYVRRTRKTVPPEFHELAKAGGAGALELLD